MLSKFKNKPIYAGMFACLLSANVHAQSETDFWQGFSNKREAGGFLSLGASFSYGGGLLSDIDTRTNLVVSGNYYFENGLFIEVPGNANKFEPSWAMGYNLYNTDDWEFDLIYSSAHGPLEYRVHPKEGGDKDLTAYLGLRMSGEVGNYQFQAIFAPNADNSEYNDGLYASAWLARSWQYKNWHFYGSIGLQYRNSNMLDYYYGVPDSAVMLKPYDASGGVNTHLKVGFTKPLNDAWVLDGTVGITDYASSIDDSPYSQLAKTYNPNRSELGRHIALTLSYVF
ncbi:MipA/OmpV family protein [Pseudoalteromonas luteoviolacea]|uniref:MipA/OmpV family protein n=1 Tax=Pseudoalteromonas luteoviolacea TaxID=43657 RepID=UPI001B3609CF|nr:MipA/OmpV family protein [Pseudoalteromonas luteoviolacea]MBQ4813236.1 MipA/OmpV family protein [Pseudoalteromonas luteoviolacea]